MPELKKEFEKNEEFAAFLGGFDLGTFGLFFFFCSQVFDFALRALGN